MNIAQPTLTAGGNGQAIALEAACEFIRGVTFDTAETSPIETPDGVPILRAGNIQKEIDFHNDLLWVPPERVSSNQFLRPGDIVVCMSSGSASVVGKTCQVRRHWRGSVGAFCGIIRPKDACDSDFLSNWLRSPSFTAWRDAQARGANIQNLRFSEMAKITLPWPPQSQRHRIAARLGEQLAAVTQAAATVQAQITAAQALPAAHLRSVFSNSVARDWPRQAVADVCQLLPSRSIALAGDTEVRAITSACLTETGFNPAGVKTARMWKPDAQESVVQSGEILIARSNTPDLVGRVSIYTGGPKGVVASDLTIRLWPRAEIRSEFLVGYLSFLYTSEYWRERAGGASGTMKKITRSQIEEERVPVPSASVQESVAGRLKTELPTALDIERLLEERLATLDHLPAALLREAFGGRL
jgi:type I restriction enzyme S subunit